MINKKSSLFSLIFLFSQFLQYFASFNIPFGVEEGDELIKFSDKPQISRKSLLNFPFKFFERKQNLIFISANGAVSFVEPFDPKAEDLTTEHKDIIAVFYAPSSNGNIFYRSSQTENLLSRELSAKVRRAFGANQFEASSVLLVTWNDLLNEKSEANTFQLALVADSNETYAIFVFGTINWTKSGGRLAQTGFFSIDGRNDKVLDQGNSAGEVSKGTNFNEPGIYIYRISGNEPTDPKRSTDIDDYEYQQENPEYEQDDQIIECPPDPFRDKCPPTCNLVMDDNHCSLCICSSVHSSSENLAGSAYSTLTNDLGQELPIRNQRPQPAIQRASDLSCAPQSSISQCHSKAICIQYKSGYCCECEKGYIGNGVECILQDEALRINGVFEAVINGKSIQKTELFSFIQPNEGQQHTALAKINSEIVWSLLLVDSLSSSFGWLFAKTSSKQHKNGFQLTGGNFTRIVNIYLGERYLLVIRQEFTDRQFSDQFNVNVILSGTLPEISGPVQVSIPEFEENYRKEKPGMLRSYSERYILFRGVGSEEQKFRVTVDQQIHFTECPHNLPQDSDSFTVKYERISSSFKEDENVVRFASQSSIINEKEKDKNEGKIINYNNDGINIEQNSNTQDPCSSGRHFCNLPNMLCVQIQINPGYRCECKPGFRLIEDNNVEQRMTCQLVDKLENIVLPAPSINPSTSLQPGECNRHDQCHQWGECVFGPIPGFPGKCKCRGWYVGDGLNHCGPPDQQQQSQQPSQNTVGITPSRGEICHKNEECGDNAKCEYSAKHGYWICFCLDGYYKQGEGSEAECLPEQKKEQKHEQKNNLNSETNQNNVGENVLQTHDNNPSAIIPTTRKQCSDATDCHPFGSCLLSEQTNAHFCFCLPGYQGDGVEKCELSEECSPTDIHGCPFPNQECRFEHSLRKFACQCKDGFTKQKDGKCLFQSTESLPISSIDRCKQCGTNSKCVQEKQKQSEGEENIIWNCICNTGYTGNGFECREENCLDLPQMCSANAQCLPDASKATYLCICNYGYSGDGKICEPIYQRTKDTPDKLLIGRGMAIIQRSTAPNLDESGRQLIVQQHQTVVAIDYDCISERIYWSDISGHSIRSAYLNGTEITSSYSDLLRSPEGIAIDWRSQNIYYVDSIKNELGVVSIDGKFQRTLLKEGLNNPRALVIDMESRQLFYSDWSRDAPKIGRIGLDGSGNKVIISDEILLPNGLVMLQYRRWLCWVDAGNQRLTCSALDGSNRKVIYAPLEYPFGLTVDSQEDRFYWTDWKDQKIHSVDIFGKGYTEFFPGAGGRGKLYGILSLPVKCHFHKAPSECIKKGNCAHWCLPGSQIGEFTCVCPENINGLDGC